MWLQTGNEQQWLTIEHRRIESQARAANVNTAGVVTAVVRVGRFLRAVLERPRTGTAEARFGRPGTAW